MKVVRVTLVALAALLVAAPAVAQTGYPDRPIRIIVGFTPGSATDITARMFALKLNAAWNVPVTVENIPGAGGSVGGERVAKATPDGTTLYWGANGAMTINPSLSPSPTFDPARDLAPIARVLVMASIVAINNDMPAKSVAELFALAKAKPGQLSYASPGVGTPQHIAGELLKGLAGVDIIHVPYRGAVLTDVMSGRVTMTLQNMGTILPVVRDGKLRGLAVTSLERVGDHSRAADARGVRVSGLRSRLLVRAAGAGRHAGADHCQAARGHREDRRTSRHARTPGAARPRCRGQLTRRIRRGHQGRHRQMGEGDQGRQHQAERIGTRNFTSLNWFLKQCCLLRPAADFPAISEQGNRNG